MTMDAGQRSVRDAGATASAVVVGAPGTGKTHLLVARVAALFASGVGADELVVLTPTRQAATALRDRIGVAIEQATPGPVARSIGSFAFHLVRSTMVHAGLAAPALLTGADQDRIIADLLDSDAADESEGLVSRWPEQLGSAVRASATFRAELRSFLADCSEWGIDAAELSALGHPAWASVASFLGDYRRVLDGMRTAYRDAAELLSEAASVLERSEPAALGAFARLRVVLIDDAQELTRGGVAMVQALRARGIAVMAFGDPDISSGAFRGASPALFTELSALLGTEFVLDQQHRQHEELRDLVRRVTQSIGAAGRVQHRRPPERDDDAEYTVVSAFLAPSPHEEFDRIAGVLRDWHINGAVPWDDLAVIAHDTRQVTTLEGELAAREVPTRAAGVQRPLGSERIVRDILAIVQLGRMPVAERTAALVSEALLSPFGGMDSVNLRRLRARLRHRELADDGARSADELLCEAMAFPASLTLIDAPEARIAHRFANTLAELAAATDDTIHDLLWRIWDRSRALDGSRLDTHWQRAALQPGGADISRALDALVSLFDAAKRFVERSPHERPEAFVHDVLTSAVPEDSLSAPERPGRVTILTPANALGREFSAVIIAGVQDGVWPNVRLRGGLLESWRLADAVAAARGGEPAVAAAVLDRRRAALHDELRLFVRAVSRAKHTLVMTAVDDDDASPSPFFRFFPPPTTVHVSAEHPLTLRGFVARHRRTLTTSAGPAAQEAAEQLAVLADAGIPGADPAQWYGISPLSSTAPLRDLSVQPVRVSPSRMEAFEACALDWVIRELGGDTRSSSAGLGTILHAAMEEYPTGGLDDLHELVEQRWGELSFDAPWMEQKERRRAQQLTERLHLYLRRAAEGTVVGSEVPFEVEIALDDPPQVIAVRWPGSEEQAMPLPDTGARPRAILRGSIDRIELYPPGAGEMIPVDEAHPETPRMMVVDLKTGRNEKHFLDAHVTDHAQLSAYQLATSRHPLVTRGEARLAGSRLVVLSRTLKNTHYRLASQAAHDDDARAAFLERLAADATGMAGEYFIAHLDSHCTSAPFAVCRIHTVKSVSAS